MSAPGAAAGVRDRELAKRSVQGQGPGVAAVITKGLGEAGVTADGHRAFWEVMKMLWSQVGHGIAQLLKYTCGLIIQTCLTLATPWPI